MDFIEQLPKSSGYTAILVVVDHFTKQAIFIHWEKGFILNLGICIGKWMNI